MTSQESQEFTSSKPTVLLIDDNADEWFLIRRAFSQRFPQLEVVWLINAEEVIPYLENRCHHQSDLPRLIAVDLYLPTSSSYIPSAQVGIGVIQALKSHHLYRQIPLVTISRSAHADDMIEAFKYSTNSYVVKPDDYSGWLEALNDFNMYWPEIDKKISAEPAKGS